MLDLPTFVTRLTRRGRTLPSFKRFRIDLSAEKYAGRMILVCFWDMKQRPSRNCIRQLSERAEELAAQGVLVAAVHASKIDAATLDEYVKKNGISFPVGKIRGNEQETRSTWGVKSLPWLILTDADHVVLSDGFSVRELDDQLKK